MTYSFDLIEVLLMGTPRDLCINKVGHDILDYGNYYGIITWIMSRYS